MDLEGDEGSKQEQMLSIDLLQILSY